MSRGLARAAFVSPPGLSNSPACIVLTRYPCPCTDHGVSGEAKAEAFHAFEGGKTMSPFTAAAISNQTIQESMRLILLVRSFQVSAVYPRVWPGLRFQMHFLAC